MPLVAKLDGINIYIYGREHRPPHIHVYYGEFEIIMIIKNGKKIAGNMPANKSKMAFEWLSRNSVWALGVFYSLNPKLK